MKTSCLLYLSTHQMIAYRWHSGKLTSEGQFTATENGYKAFAHYLAQNRKNIFSILVNVSEEGFQIEKIPYLQGADRQTVIRRKLGQLFFTATLTASLSLGYEKSKRKDERVMLAALTNNAFFTPWLNAISHVGIALSGIYSLPLLVTAFLKKLDIVEEQCLLLTVQDQSIRQSYIKKGQLNFSRLTPLQNSSICGIAQTFSSEVPKLQQYLISQRLIGRNQPITAYVLAHTSTLKAIQSSCINTPTIHYNILSIEDCAKKTGLKTPLLNTHCEQIFLNLLVASPPRIQFANDDLRHGYHLKQIRYGLRGIGATALLGCLLFSGKLLFEAHTITQETEILNSEASLYRQRYADILKTFPPIPTDNETLRRVIDQYAELNKKSITPNGLYREISRALQTTPTAELVSIDWQIGGKTTNMPNPTGQTAIASPVPDDSEAAIVRGILKQGSNTDARQMLNTFDHFLDALRATPKLRVEILQRPFDIESGKTLKGADITLEDDKPRSFSLQIIRKIGS